MKTAVNTYRKISVVREENVSWSDLTRKRIRDKSLYTVYGFGILYRIKFFNRLTNRCVATIVHANVLSKFYCALFFLLSVVAVTIFSKCHLFCSEQVKIISDGPNPDLPKYLFLLY